MIRALAAALVILSPAAAQALSCLPHSVEAAYLEADASDARFIIVRGRLDFDRRAMPKVDWDNQQNTPPVTEISADFLGKSLSGGEFRLPFERAVTLRVECIGPWCASAPEGVDVLAFVELREDGPDVIATNPCGGYLFGSPKPRMIRAVKDCAAGKSCVPVR
ncbi:hypothetical protein ABMC89_10145 [Sulfitobacter sp. HNIBRBA3233]|uniref:hypothetical protein n=1 Tax=Sulfitobacter marinivivus TaxID=3158558 RepID=UPI0032DF9A92